LLPNPVLAQSVARAKFNPVVVQSGTSTSCTIELTAPAGPNGFRIGMSTVHPFVRVPDAVTVASGSKQISFNVSIDEVPSNVWATVAFSDGSRSVQASVEAIAPVDLADVSMTPDFCCLRFLRRGSGATHQRGAGRWFLTARFQFSTLVQVPATVTVPAGKQDSSFPVTTTEVQSLKAATITVRSPERSADTWLQIVQNPSVKSLNLSSTSIVGGYGLAGKVILDSCAPPAGTVVNFSSDSTRDWSTTVSIYECPGILAAA
ncbi:MAG TPA: hypothetical protein VG944_12580, partial [Fimbriimonas sp.]|nr:hypothetical protein [Fimbriimonas sp.]